MPEKSKLDDYNKLGEKMKKYFFTLALLIVASTGHTEENIALNTNPNASSTFGNIALGARISTLGVGPELSVGLSDYWTVRGAAHWGSYSVEGDTDDMEYDCDLNLASGLATIEWNVFAGGFHIDAGVLLNGNNIDASGKATNGTITINDVDYTAEQAGTIKGGIDFNSVAPYLGLGWGNPVDADTTWTFFFNLGVIFQGSPDVSLSADGRLSTDATFLQNLQQEEQELQEDLDAFKYYPVIALGLTYKF